MEIGKPRRIHRVEPLRLPVPAPAGPAPQKAKPVPKKAPAK
jgi:hypothetical protein